MTRQNRKLCIIDPMQRNKQPLKQLYGFNFEWGKKKIPKPSVIYKKQNLHCEVVTPIALDFGVVNSIGQMLGFTVTNNISTFVPYTSDVSINILYTIIMRVE